jgi:hypothetical protein
MMPLVLLFQGKFEQAKARYLTWKTQPFSGNFTFADAFQEDFEFFEYLEGLTHPDIQKIKALLGADD